MSKRGSKRKATESIDVGPYQDFFGEGIIPGPKKFTFTKQGLHGDKKHAGFKYPKFIHWLYDQSERLEKATKMSNEDRATIAAVLITLLVKVRKGKQLPWWSCKFDMVQVVKINMGKGDYTRLAETLKAMLTFQSGCILHGKDGKDVKDAIEEAQCATQVAIKFKTLNFYSEVLMPIAHGLIAPRKVGAKLFEAVRDYGDAKKEAVTTNQPKTLEDYQKEMQQIANSRTEKKKKRKTTHVQKTTHIQINMEKAMLKFVQFTTAQTAQVVQFRDEESKSPETALCLAQSIHQEQFANSSGPSLADLLKYSDHKDWCAFFLALSNDQK